MTARPAKATAAKARPGGPSGQYRQSRKRMPAASVSVSKKSAYGVLFRDLRRFPLAPHGVPGRETAQGNLAAQACESAAHVAGFGLHLEGYGPPNHPKRFFDSLSRLPAQGKAAFFAAWHGEKTGTNVLVFCCGCGIIKWTRWQSHPTFLYLTGGHGTMHSYEYLKYTAALGPRRPPCAADQKELEIGYNCWAHLPGMQQKPH